MTCGYPIVLPKLSSHSLGSSFTLPPFNFNSSIFCMYRLMLALTLLFSSNLHFYIDRPVL